MVGAPPLLDDRKLRGCTNSSIGIGGGGGGGVAGDGASRSRGFRRGRPRGFFIAAVVCGSVGPAPVLEGDAAGGASLGVLGSAGGVGVGVGERWVDADMGGGVEAGVR